MIPEKIFHQILLLGNAWRDGEGGLCWLWYRLPWQTAAEHL